MPHFNLTLPIPCQKLHLFESWSGKDAQKLLPVNSIYVYSFGTFLLNFALFLTLNVVKRFNCNFCLQDARFREKMVVLSKTLLKNATLIARQPKSHDIIYSIILIHSMWSAFQLFNACPHTEIKPSFRHVYMTDDMVTSNLQQISISWQGLQNWQSYT